MARAHIRQGSSCRPSPSGTQKPGTATHANGTRPTPSIPVSGFILPVYFMSSTIRNNLSQRMPEKPRRSGSLLHHIKIGFPTMWSSGTKPQ